MARCNGDCLNCIYDDCIATDADCVNFEKQEKNFNHTQEQKEYQRYYRKQKKENENVRKQNRR